ncbi:magnesium ion transporter [Onygenales sp. PD_12]|nr:magnesium ion transporter [Onygenales sp. PD_12]
MVSPSSLKPTAAPSANLLRFLRSQSEPISYFSSNLAHPSSARPATSPPCPWRYQGQHANANGYERCTATLQASLIPPFFNPRTRKPTTTTTTLSSPASASSPRSLTKQPLQPFSSTQTRRSKNFLRRLFGFRVSEREGELRLNDLPAGLVVEDGQEGNMFSTARSLALKATNEPRLRCTEFDGAGNVTLVNGEFKKSELIAKYGLLPRDLRKIDSSVLPHILVRHSAILISLLHLRVLIKSDRVLVFDAYGSADSYTQSVFMYDLEGKLRQKEPAGRQASPGALPYEFRALEAVLVSVTGGLEAEFEGVREPVVRVLRALEEDIDRDKLRHLLIYSKRLGTFEQKARLVRDAIDDLLEADDDLTAMYLTEKGNGIHRQEQDHQEVEMLLESYHKVCDEIVQASGNLVTNIRNTEEVVKAILDANRNSLMLLDLKFSIGTLGLAAGTLCSALYGMNLKNFIEESDLGFAGVSAICFVFTAFVCTYGLMKLRKVQRVRMWGEGGSVGDRSIASLGLRACGPPPSSSSSMAGRGSWRAADSVDPLWMGQKGESRVDRLRRLRHGSVVETAKRTAAGAGSKKNKRTQSQTQQSAESEVPETGSEEAATATAAGAAGTAAFGSSAR